MLGKITTTSLCLLALATVSVGQTTPAKPTQRRIVRPVPQVTQQPQQFQRFGQPQVTPVPDSQVPAPKEADPEFPTPAVGNGQDVPVESDGEAEIDPSAPVETVEERYEDGRTKVRREVTLDLNGNYVKHGQWTMFDRESNETAGGKFNNNKREGVWSRTYALGEAKMLNNPPYSTFEGPFTSTATFKNGKLNGVWKVADAEGRICSECNYEDGLLHGEARWSYPSGSPQKQVNFKNGLMDGAYKEWSDEDKLIVDDTYQAGRKLASKQKLYENGGIQWEGMFLHERNEIDKAGDWWNGEAVSYKKVGDPIRHGKLTSWYASGQKQSEGIFQNNVRAGEFTWWHKNTQKAVQGVFKEGEAHGVWTWWHENGQKSIHGQYDMGKPSGEWHYWRGDGRLEKRTNHNGGSEPVAGAAIIPRDRGVIQVGAAAPRKSKSRSRK